MHAIINTTICIPEPHRAFGVVLAAADIRPLFIELGGIRLEGSTHPAFLGGFAAAAIYAAVLELFREGRSRHLWALVVNYIILVLSGARAPLFLAFLVTLIAFVRLRSEQFAAAPAHPCRCSPGCCCCRCRPVASVAPRRSACST